VSACNSNRSRHSLYSPSVGFDDLFSAFRSDFLKRTRVCLLTAIAWTRRFRPSPDLTFPTRAWILTKRSSPPPYRRRRPTCAVLVSRKNESRYYWFGPAARATHRGDARHNNAIVCTYIACTQRGIIVTCTAVHVCNTPRR